MLVLLQLGKVLQVLLVSLTLCPSIFSLPVIAEAAGLGAISFVGNQVKGFFDPVFQRWYSRVIVAPVAEVVSARIANAAMANPSKAADVMENTMRSAVAQPFTSAWPLQSVGGGVARELLANKIASFSLLGSVAKGAGPVFAQAALDAGSAAVKTLERLGYAAKRLVFDTNPSITEHSATEIAEVMAAQNNHVAAGSASVSTKSLFDVYREAEKEVATFKDRIAIFLMEAVWINAGNSRNSLIITDAAAQGITNAMLRDPARSREISERIGKVLAEEMLRNPAGLFQNAWNFAQGAIPEINDAVFTGLGNSLITLNNMIEKIGVSKVDPEMLAVRNRMQEQLSEIELFSRYFRVIVEDDQPLTFQSGAVKDARVASEKIGIKSVTPALDPLSPEKAAKVATEVVDNSFMSAFIKSPGITLSQGPVRSKEISSLQ